MVANSNIRYLILGGPESAGHLTGQALKALMQNGIDSKKRIIGSESPHPFLYNIPAEFVERFRKQLTLIDLQFEGDPEIIRNAVWSCYQEEPVDFRSYRLYDLGAYPEEPLSGKITWRVTMPWSVPENEKEEEALKKAKELLEKLRAKYKQKNH
ncbi:MAG: hypothetical protein M1365_01095 [Actinobacteria bacterium]|nr:hypothetical protein [Actinomycetota bacterium]